MESEVRAKGKLENKMGMDSRCTGCRWNVPKKFGGEGLQCDGGTMRAHNCCPEWVINWYTNYQFKGNGQPMLMDNVVEANRL